MSKKTENIVDAERMRYDVSKLLTKYINVNLPSNLDRQQLQGLKELKADTNIKVVPFDKGTGFALMESHDMISKIREQIGDARIIRSDPTNSLVRKFQKEISRLKKEEKIDVRTFH